MTRRLVVQEFLTLDGVMQGPGGPDEDRLLIHPIVLGKGKKLFRDDAARASLRLVEAVTSPTGVVLATYVPAR